jgi:hypothetical protein
VPDPDLFRSRGIIRSAVARVRGDDLIAIGLEPGLLFGVALNALPPAVKRLGRDEALAELGRVVAEPEAHTGHAYFAKVAEKLVATRAALVVAFAERDAPAPFQSWSIGAEQDAVHQMENALRLPSAVRGALMPDAHLGYGRPCVGCRLRGLPVRAALPAAPPELLDAQVQARRLRVFCDAYGLGAADRAILLATVPRQVAALRDLIVSEAASGNPVFAAHLADGHVKEYDTDLAYLRASAATHRTHPLAGGGRAPGPGRHSHRRSGIAVRRDRRPGRPAARRDRGRGAARPAGHGCPWRRLGAHGPGRFRTCDLGIKSPLLYQLSYRPSQRF